MSLKSLLRIAEDYLKKHPAPTSIDVMKGMLKLSYTYSAPATNSKSKKQVFYPVDNLKANNYLQSLTPMLNFDEKTNRLEYSNNFDSISTQQAHEKVLQDAIFGNARLNKNQDKWIYAAKKKISKPKSYFLGGSGKSIYSPDLGETYDDVSEVGIYIWDLKQKKIVSVDIKIENEQGNYIFSCPIFSNDEGTKFICHGYKKMQFGYGVSFCFNRNVSIFEISIENIGQQDMKIKCEKIIKKHQTNMFANISPCYNYILYFGGNDTIHSYYLDLIILKRKKMEEIIQIQDKQMQSGYHSEWSQIHCVKKAFIGSYFTIKTETFTHHDQNYAYFQTVENSEQRIKCINLQTGEITNISQNKIGTSYAISSFQRSEGLIVGNLTTHAFNTFFYFKAGENELSIIPPLAQEEFKIQQFHDPIHGYYLESENIDEQFKKQKRPLLVLVHGGPHSHADPCLTLFKYMLLKCGYSILMPNYSGSAGFGDQYLKGALGNIGTKDAEQIIQLVDKVLEKKEHVDKQRVYIYGGSYGGYMAAIMGSRYQKRFKSAVILNGVLSVIGNFWFSDIPEWSTAETLKQGKIHDLTSSDYMKMFEQSPIFSSMKIPTLQFLGAKDRRVPYRQGLLFDAMVRKAGTPIQTFVYENAAHSLSDSVDTALDVVIKSMQFLEGIPIKEQKPAQKK